MKFYAGIGSRETPLEICHMMTHAATWLDNDGWTLRSGGADGADAHFSYGSKDKEIYIPWNKFNNLYHNGNTIIDIAELPEQNVLAARQIAQQNHPAWFRCSSGARMLHTRNVFQIYGRDFKQPSSFVLCYTRGGSGEGGTGQALRIAKMANIPIFDLGRPDLETVQEECFNFVSSFKEKALGSA